MIRDFMSLAHGTPEDLRVVHDVLAHDEKSRFHAMRGEEIEQFRRKGRVRTVVERERDIGPLDVDGIEGDLRLSR